jgi:hypothetical protein
MVPGYSSVKFELRHHIFGVATPWTICSRVSEMKVSNPWGSPSRKLARALNLTTALR